MKLFIHIFRMKFGYGHFELFNIIQSFTIQAEIVTSSTEWKVSLVQFIN